MENSETANKQQLDEERVDPGDDPNEGGTAPNPSGFFAELTDSNACSVAVAVRVRPLVGRELTEGSRKLCVVPPEGSDGNRLQIGVKSFNFDRVFWAEESQEYIFDTCTRNLVLGCFHGFNATILAYGQTGSGKTHSMGTGPSIGVPFEQVGIVPRVFKFIFDELALRRAQSEYSEFKVRISFMELYNEELHDLLDPASMQRDRITGKAMKDITIREEKNGVISVRGLSEMEVNSQEQCIHLLNSGINHRQTSSTLMNEGSSRSHAIFTITIEQKIVKEVDEAPGPDGEKGQKDDGEKQLVTEEISSKFHFVDLAGSERIKKTGATGKLKAEGISINKGLLCLGQVISALTDEKRKNEHIPYRDSKLTRILQDSLGGNSRTTMIACVSPAESNYEESLGTINYASRARNIKNKPVVNRDPNSMLIESLRTQIQQLQFEVKEFAALIQNSGISMPNDLSEKFLERQKMQEDKLQRQRSIQQAPSGSANPQEVKELKIKLSHKDREIRELQQRLKDQQVFLDQKDKQLKEVEKERDNLALKSESMAEKLKTNNIEFDSKQFDQKPGQPQSQDLAQKSTLIDQYKAKLAKAQKDLDQKIREMQEKDQKYLNLKQASDRNDRILKKHMDENQTLKRQLQAGGSSNLRPSPSTPVTQEALPQKRDFKTMRAQRKEQATKSIEEFNQKFLTDLQSQIDDMFTNVANRKAQTATVVQDAAEEEQKANDDTTIDSVQKESQQDQEDAKEDNQSQQQNNKPIGSEDNKAGESAEQTQAKPAADADPEVAEKERILLGVRKYAMSMQSDIKDLLKNEWAGSIKTLEGQKKKAESDRQESLMKAKNDTKAVQAIEKEHLQKMEGLNSQVAKLEKEKQKKEESVAKQIAMQEGRIKALEADLEKQKKKKEEVEKAKKYDEDRFFKFKLTASKDLQQEKKKTSEKEKQMSKLKSDLKKVDQLAQQKIFELKGLQKRSQEEKQKRAQMEQKEYDAKGIDIDLIKDWISSNTDAMLKHQELKEYLQKQIDQKDKVENEMLEEGDGMTELLIMKEKLAYEKEELEAVDEDQRDVGRILEIDDQLKDIELEIASIVETLDMLEETLEFVHSKVSQVTEEIEGFDDTIQPMSFNALDNIESAKATLKTFFQVVLDLNIYKRDLEQKCIEQDENVIHLEANLKSVEARIRYMIENGTHDGYASHVAKQQAISTVLKQVDGFVDNRDVEHLNLNPTEQTNLTKLSLSKIVNNLKNKLKEQEVKNQNITLKLDQALKQKEIYKSRCDELKQQQKSMTQQPRSRAYQGVSSKLTAHEQQNSATFTGYQNKTESDVPNIGRSAAGVPRRLSFKDRQRQKKELQAQGNSGRYNARPGPAAQQPAAMAKPVESLADRRKNRKNLIDQDSVNQLGDDLDKLKQNAEYILDREGNKESDKLLGGNVLEDISEEDGEGDDDKELQVKKKLGVNLTTIKEVDGEEGLAGGDQAAQLMAGSPLKVQVNNSEILFSNGDGKDAIGYVGGLPQSTYGDLEPDQNFSQFMNMQKMMEQESQVFQEEWVQEHFIELAIGVGSKLVDFFFLNTKMMCIFENFQVQEIDLRTKEVLKNYNLQEIEGFEISEDAEEDRVVAFALEKDVQLVGVACVDSVHVFEYAEDEENSLTHVSRISQTNIEQLVFVEYILVMVQEVKAQEPVDQKDQDQQAYVTIMCSDLESDGIKGTTQIERTSSTSQVLIKPGDECVYFVVGAQIGKIEVPTMTEVFKINSGHTEEILDMSVSALNQVITTSKDGSIRFFNSQNGQSISEPMEEMECDHLASHGIHLLTRMGHGEERTMLVWRLQTIGGVEENPVDEVEFSEEDKNLADKALKFKMKGGVVVNPDDDGRDTEQLVMMFASIENVTLKLLTQKLSKF